jgi:hypothetical protein
MYRYSSFVPKLEKYIILYTGLASAIIWIYVYVQQNFEQCVSQKLKVDSFRKKVLSGFKVLRQWGI